MKTLKAIATGALLLFICLHTSAQQQLLHLNEPDQNRPKIFSDLPERMNMKLTGMDSLLSMPVGSTVFTRATENLLIEGIIVSRSDATDPNVQSVVIRLSNRPGAVFTYTKKKAADGTWSYIGRIMSRNNGDAFELVHDNGQYVLLKKNINDMMVE